MMSSSNKCKNVNPVPGADGMVSAAAASAPVRESQRSSNDSEACKSEAKSELMESAHLLCSLFGSSTKPSTSALTTTHPHGSSRTRKPSTSTSRGPPKKRPKSNSSAGGRGGNDSADMIAKATENRKYYNSIGYTTLLYTQGEDEKYLSPQLCLTRSQIELFAATESDIASRRSAGGRSISRSLHIGSVGLRCIHCKHLPLRERAQSAVHYPGCIRLVYQSVRNFQRHHLNKCSSIPEPIKAKFRSFKRVQSKGTSHVYWTRDCAEKGLVDTDCGIRICLDDQGKPVRQQVQESSPQPPTIGENRCSDGELKRPSKKAKSAIAAPTGRTGTRNPALAASAYELPLATELRPPALSTQVTLDEDMKKTARFQQLLLQEEEKRSETTLAAELKLPALSAQSTLDEDMYKAVRLQQQQGGRSKTSLTADLKPPSLSAQVTLDDDIYKAARLQQQQQEEERRQAWLISATSSAAGAASAAAGPSSGTFANAAAAAAASHNADPFMAQASLREPSLAASLMGPATPPPGSNPLYQHQLLQQQVLGQPRSTILDPTSAAAVAAQAHISDALDQIEKLQQADLHSTCRREYVSYLQTLDNMSAAIALAKNLAAACSANPTPALQFQSFAANKGMAAIMYQAKMQAVNLQRLRLESRIQDLNASIEAELVARGLPSSEPVRRVSFTEEE